MKAMTDRYERIRQALEGLRERCAQEAERITGRRRAVAAMTNNEAVKPCEVAAAIRKIDVQQHHECAAREIDRLREMLQSAFQRGYQSGARGLREMYDAIQEVKRQDAWGNALLTEALLASEERAERAEADAARWRYIRRKLCLTGNGDGTYRMEALNLPARIQGQPEHGKLDDFYDAAIDDAMSKEGK